MSHPTATPDAVVEAYVATWNETDPARRRAGLAAAWIETGIYRDPVMASDGPAGIDAMLAGVQAKFPGFVLKRTSTVDTHGGPSGSVEGRYLRFTWSLGPADGPSVVEGVDSSAPWRRTGGSRPWSASSTRCRGSRHRAGRGKGPSAALEVTTRAQRRKVRRPGRGWPGSSAC